MRDGPLDESHRPVTPQQTTCQRSHVLQNTVFEREDVRFNILLAQRDMAPSGQVLEVRRVLGCWHCPVWIDLIAKPGLW